MGLVYSGTAFTASYVYTTIGTPSSGPRSGDVYSELISVFDSAGYYDQLGLISNYCPISVNPTCQSTDAWMIGWQQQNCNGIVGTNLAAKVLQPYADYTFEMVLRDGTLNFYVYNGTGTAGSPYWSHGVSDSATALKIQNTILWCGSNDEDFTDWEEVENISNPNSSFPQWNFGFAGTYGGTTLIDQWGSASSNNVPSEDAYQTYVYDIVSNNFFRIDNLGFWISFPWSAYNTTPGGTFNDAWGSINADGPSSGNLCGGSGCPYSLSCSMPAYFQSGSAGLTGTGHSIPMSGTQYYDVTMQSSTPLGQYFSGCTVTTSATTPREFSTFIFYNDVT